MKIGLIGAPGSGKTKLAQAIAQEFLELYVIDGYVEKIQERTGLSLGYEADFLPNFLVNSERWLLEREQEDNFITCGTHVESLCYATAWSRLAHTYMAREDWEAFQARMRPSIDVGTLYLMETWNYDHVFYLPVSPEADPIDRNLDFSIQEALAILSVDHVPLTGDPLDAVAHLKDANAASTTSE